MTIRSYTPREEKQLYAGTTMFMIGNCIGASLLALGNRFNNIGWPMATSYMTVAIIFSLWGYNQVTNACMYTRYTSIPDIIGLTWNKTLSSIVSYASMFLIFGFLVTYCVIASDYLHSIYDFFSETASCVKPSDYNETLCKAYETCLKNYNKIDKIIRAIIGYVVFMALSFVNNMSILSIISTISLIMVLFAICVIIVRCLQALVTNKLPHDTGIWERRTPVVPYAPKVKSILVDFPSYFSLYTITPSIPSLYGEMKGTVAEKTKIIHKTSIYATIVLIILYMLLAYICSATFYGKNQSNFQKDNILNNFPTEDKLILAVRILYVIVISTAFVCCLFPARAILLDIMRVDKTTKRGKALFFIMGAVMVISLTTLAIFVPSITLVFDLVTSLFGFVLYLGLPILVGMKVPMLKDRREYMEARRAAMHREDPEEALKETDALEAKIRNRTNSIAAFFGVMGSGTSERIRRASETMVRRLSTVNGRVSSGTRYERLSSNYTHQMAPNRNSHVPFTDGPSTIPEVSSALDQTLSHGSLMQLDLANTATSTIPIPEQPQSPELASTTKENVQRILEIQEKKTVNGQDSTETETKSDQNDAVNANTNPTNEVIPVDYSHVISNEVLLEGFVPKVSKKRLAILGTIGSVFIVINTISFVTTVIGMFSETTDACAR